MADVAALKDRLRAQKLSPDQMTAGAARLAAAIADTRIPAGEEHYAQTDLEDFAANLEGIAKTMALLKPVGIGAPDVIAEIEHRIASAEAVLSDLKAPDGFQPYSRVSADVRRRLSETFGQLAAAIGKFNPAVGLE